MTLIYLDKKKEHLAFFTFKALWKRRKEKESCTAWSLSLSLSHTHTQQSFCYFPFNFPSTHTQIHKLSLSLSLSISLTPLLSHSHSLSQTRTLFTYLFLSHALSLLTFLLLDFLSAFCFIVFSSIKNTFLKLLSKRRGKFFSRRLNWTQETIWA